MEAEARDPVAWLLGEGYLDVRDVAGRPLGEVNAPSGYGPAGVVEETCTYPDRRAQLSAPMNVSALRQIGAAWSFVSGVMSAARIGVAGSGAPSLGQAWRAAMQLRALPIRDGLGGEPVTEARAACYKTGLGYAKIYWIAALADDPTRAAGEVLPPERFFGFLDEGDWLVGSRQVCAGPRRLIEQGHERLTGGAVGGDAAALEDADARFGDAMARLEGLAALAFSLVRERARQGRIREVEGWGRPDVAVLERWPGCVSLHQASATVSVGAIRAMSGVKPAAVVAGMEAAGFEMDLQSIEDESLDLFELDAVLARTAAPVLSKLGATRTWAQSCAEVVRRRVGRADGPGGAGGP